jgi:hypothetical protein
MKLRLSTVRLHLPLLAILLMLFSNAEAQQKKSQAKTAQKVVQKPVKDPYLGNLVKADYKYYFTGFYNKIYWDYVAPNNTAYRPVIDVRTFKPLNVWFQSAEPGRLMPDSTILQVIHDPYESTGRVLQMTPAGSMRYFTFGMIKMGEDSYNVNLSPDSKSGVFFKNNDIWSADFDYKSGKFANPRQVTKLGIFKPEVIWNWHANSIAVGNYLVNLVSGETIDLNENFLFNAVDYLKWSPDYRNYISPGDRWV